MIEKITSLLKDNISIPKILLTNYRSLKIEEKELILLIYLMNNKDSLFNPELISNDLKLSLPEVLEEIEKLNNADVLSINTNKNNGVIEEVIDLSNLYKKLAYLVINEEDKIKEEKSNIYDTIEKEFGRQLSPMEYELISGWLDEYSEEIIICSLKEAVYNGASNLRYMDKILYEWNKKGIKTKEDVEKDKKNFKKNKKIEMVDYDWLNEEQNN